MAQPRSRRAGPIGSGISRPASAAGKPQARSTRAARLGDVGDRDGGEASSVCGVEDWLESELRAIVGLERVKDQMRAFLKNLRLERRRQELGLPKSVEVFDMVLFGNPGTGKTSVARLIPEMMRQIGILKAGAPFLEVGRSDLVGSVIGATEERTAKVIKSARTGILFVDEAYTLTPGGDRDFGLKALELIMQTMTQTDADRPIFIFAGYRREMETFLASNPGMARRIAFKFHFHDFSTGELALILRNKSAERKLELSPEAEAALPSLLDAHFPSHIRTLWNAGLAGRLLSESVQCLNKRLAEPEKASREELITLQLSDLQEGAQSAAEAMRALASEFADIDENDKSAAGGKWRGSRGCEKAFADMEHGAQKNLSQSLLDTKHMKLYWPSALRRIAALEVQLQPAAACEDRLERKAKGGQLHGDEPPNDDGHFPAKIGPMVGDAEWIANVKALCALATKAASEQDPAAVIESLTRAVAVAETAGKCRQDGDEPSAPLPIPATPPLASPDRKVIASREMPLEARIEGEGDGQEQGDANERKLAEDNQNALACWLAAVRDGKLKLGDKIPASWREGLHFTLDPSHEFRPGEIVVALRSNGERTVAKIGKVMDGAAAVELAVGECLQKVMRVSAVGKIARALDDFVRLSLDNRMADH